MVKHLSTMRETRIRSLGWDNPLEKGMVIHSRAIPWKIPWTEEAGRLQSMGSQRVGHNWATSLSLSLKWKGHLFGCVSSKRSCRSSQNRLNSASSALLDYCDIEWFALETNRDHSVFLRLHPNTAFQTLFVDNHGYSIYFKGFLPTVVDLMVTWVKFTHSSPFSSLISRMLTFTLAISFWPLPVFLDSRT